jgi:hypothetical protein
MHRGSLKFRPVPQGVDSSRSATSTPAQSSPSRPSPSRFATSLTLAAMSLGYGVVQLDVTIVNTALSSIGASLGGGVFELQWIVSANTIAFAAFVLTAGALGDRIGAKRLHRRLRHLHSRIAPLRVVAECAELDRGARRAGAGRGHPRSQSACAGRGPVRLAGRTIRCVHDGCACIAWDLGAALVSSRAGDLARRCAGCVVIRRASPLAQREMRAAKRHRRAEAEGGQSRQHAGDRRNPARRRGLLARTGQQQHADRDQELPHPLRNLS